MAKKRSRGSTLKGFVLGVAASLGIWFVFSLATLEVRKDFYPAWRGFFSLNEQEQEWSAWFLAQNDLEYLKGCMKSPYPNVRRRAAQAIGNHRHDQCELIRDLLLDNDRLVRYWGLYGLEKSDCADRVELASRLLRDVDEDVAKLARAIVHEAGDI